MGRRSARLRVMLDANILVAGTAWPRWPHEVLLAGLRGDYQLVLSPYVIKQARRVLSRRFAVHVDRLEELLYSADIELVPDPTPEEVARSSDLVRDETDVPVALAAIDAEVDYLISEDKDLTARDDTTVILRQKLTVLLSGTFLRKVLGWTSKDLERIRHRTWRDLEQQ